MCKARVLAVVSTLLLPMAFVLAAHADSQVRIVRLSLVDGPVQIDRAIGQGFEKAIVNMPLAQGMQLRTQGSSRAEVEFEDGTTMRLAPGAEVAFPNLTLLASGGRASTVRVEDGTVYFNVRHKDNDDFRVLFADQQVDLRRSAHFRLDLARDQAELAVFKGDLQLNGNPQAKVKKRETLTVNLAGQGQYQLAKGIAPEDYDSWDARRIDFEDRYASARSSDLPYYYGRGDLNYYGSWGYVSGYGNLWRPFGVGYGWDPFSYGAWAWYPGWGYTWVSTYPWGWMPYRYGTWLWVSNYGWCWRPGGFNTWYTIPTVVNPPPAYRPPQPPPATALTGSTGGPHPIVIVKDGAGGFGPPRVPLDGRTAPRGTSASTGTNLPATGAVSTTTPTAPATTATAPAAVPARSVIPTSGPGMGRRPTRLDDAGLPRARAARVGENGRPMLTPSPRMAAPRTSAPAAAPERRMSAPASSPRMSAPPRVSDSPAPRSSPPPASRPPK